MFASFFRRLSRPSVDFKQLVADGALIVDVRTAGEFNSGHIEKAVNIPLDQLKKQLPALQKKNRPIITCCRSGARSGMANTLLSGAGITCYNAGAWTSLRQKL